MSHFIYELYNSIYNCYITVYNCHITVIELLYETSDCYIAVRCLILYNSYIKVYLTVI